jgi:hypothetical protein
MSEDPIFLEEVYVVQEPPPFEPFPKIPRWSRDIVITEKIDGTNGRIVVLPDGRCIAGSKNRYLSVDSRDGFGFAQWVEQNYKLLAMLLGTGTHLGEWWGEGIQRGYGVRRKKFSLFNVSRWAHPCEYYPLGGKEFWGGAWAEHADAIGLDVVPVLYVGENTNYSIHLALSRLQVGGSVAAPGFTNPEGVIIYHTAANSMFKKTIAKDEEGKWTK